MAELVSIESLKSGRSFPFNIDFASHPSFNKLPLTAKLIYSAILWRMNISLETAEYQDCEGAAFVVHTEKKLQRDLGVSRPTIERAIKSLKQLGLIKSVQESVGEPAKIYAYNWQQVATEIQLKMTEDKKPTVHQNDAPTVHQNDAPTVHQNDGQYYINTKKDSTENISDDIATAISPLATRGKAGVESSNGTSARMKKLLQQKPLTKTERNKHKWLADRAAQINGRGFNPHVVDALNSFLMSLAGTNRSSDRISGHAWNLQLDRMQQLNAYPEYQKRGIYDAAAINSKSLVWVCDRIQKELGLINDIVTNPYLATESEMPLKQTVEGYKYFDPDAE